MKRWILVGLCLTIVAGVAGAQVFSVSYLEGQVQVRSGSAWSELSIGDNVPLEASIRVQSAGCLQLHGVGADFFLNRPGTYAVRDLVAARNRISSAGIGSALANYLRFLASASTAKPSTASGARAGNTSESEDDSWVESSSQVFLEAGREYIKIGKYDQAIEQLSQALESSSDAETPEVHYFLASAACLKGDVREAWRQISGLKANASDTWAGDFVLLRTKLLVDSSAYAEAVGWLTANDLSQDAQRAQLYFFLLGLSYRGSSESAKAKLAFSKVVAISSESDLAKAAKELLQGE